jgi:Ca2+-binding EF-hand superfamily protein
VHGIRKGEKLSVDILVEDIKKALRRKYKTLSKVYSFLNMNRDTSSITPEAFQMTINQLGYTLDNEIASKLFKVFDVDGDGVIKFEDLQSLLGKEFHPTESLYFRQENPAVKQKNCLY